MSNRSTVTEFLLLGFSDLRGLRTLHFVGFLALYLAALMGNLLLVTAVALHHHLHTPTCFFLTNLSGLDLGAVSVIVPKSMANSLTRPTSISYYGCVAQAFLFLCFATAELPLLTAMAYDRHVAVCQPLHYERAMNRRACVQLAAGTWVSGVLNSALRTGNTFAIVFCGNNELGQFFCEIPASPCCLPR